MEPGARPAAIIPRNFMEAQAMCAALAAANLVPKSFRGNPADMLLVVMTGLEVGLPPMASLRLYTTWDGVPRLMAEGVRAVILHSPEIEYFEPASCSDTEATWIGKRRGRPEKSATWTIARAQKASLTEKPVWKAYPQDMLNARASMQLGRMIAPDVVAGMVALEEARDGDFIEAQFTEQPKGFVAPPVGRAPADTPELRAAIAQVQSQPSAPLAVSPAVGGTEPPKRGPGRPPKDKPADPTPSPASSSGGASTSASSTAPSPAPSTPSTAPSQSTASPSSAQPSSSSPTVVTSRDSNGFDSPTSPSSTTSPSPSAVSETTSSAGSSAEFGGDDLPDSTPTQAPSWRTDFEAWLASCANQRDLVAGLPRWRGFSKEQFKAGDKSFAGADPGPIGENAKWMQDLYARRKGEVPA